MPGDIYLGIETNETSICVGLVPAQLWKRGSAKRGSGFSKHGDSVNTLSSTIDMHGRESSRWCPSFWFGHGPRLGLAGPFAPPEEMLIHIDQVSEDRMFIYERAIPFCKTPFSKVQCSLQRMGQVP